MKGIFHLLGMNLSRNPASETENTQDGPENDGVPIQASTDDLMQGNYGQPTGDTVPMLEIIKDPSQATDRSECFDPYDTSSLEISKK